MQPMSPPPDGSGKLDLPFWILIALAALSLGSRLVLLFS